MKLPSFLVFLIAMNLVGLLVCGLDKRRAKKGQWRISEATLLLLGLFGGSFGLLLGMGLFRHKTKHWNFKLLVPLECVLWGIVLVHTLSALTLDRQIPYTEKSIYNDSLSAPPTHELEHEIAESKGLSLWEQGEEYIFQFDYNADVEQVLLKLKDNKGAIIQQLDITTPYLLSHPDLMDNVILHDENFLDFNFDGYSDYRCKYGEFGRTVVYAGWVWDPVKKQYHSTNLTDITNMWLEQRDQTVRGAFSGAGGGSMSIYRYRNGAFVETNRLDTIFEPFITDNETGALLTNYWVENESKTGFQEYHLLDGELVTVWTEIVSDTQDGQQRIQEHFFGEDSIWFPIE